MKKEKQSWTDYVPHSVSLYYVDYRENLDSHDDLQEQCIRRNSLSPLEEQILEWYADQEHGNLQGYLSEIRNEMEADGKSAEYIRHEEKISAGLNQYAGWVPGRVSILHMYQKSNKKNAI